ncbi:copper resistance protein CopC [Oscillochloris sp. ZM17-4]|uniref:copper resistance CopC family protein n=1 Tax=Oscillochloris sp. ZM17-4 TaxID=2866714 RepID=UPI001C72D08E|nr:copper resistance protein CopC [Oscillochloris sp. ZM17-4]MBX0329240.1 copper resistance protein CopC [Oscillochloris sp. ZM17-4]
MPRRHTLWPLLSLLLLASMLAFPASARARSVVVHSEPVDGSVLQKPPQMLQLWYDSSAIIEPGAVTLTDADGREVPVESFHTDIYKPDDAGLSTLFDPTFLFLCSLGLNSYPTTLMVHLPELGPGTYRMSWRAIATKDRVATTGSLVFGVDPDAPASADGGDALSQSYTDIADDLMVTLAIRPNRPGANFMSVQAAPIRRPLRAQIGEVTLRLTPPGEAPRDIVLAQANDGRFQASGDLIDRPGSWAAEVRIDRGIVPETVAHIAWDVPDSSSSPSLLVMVLALVVVVVAGGFVLMRRRRA